jgi:hypothetical protein
MISVASEKTIIENEQEAAAAILLSCLVPKQDNIQKGRVEHLSRMLLLSSKFGGHSLPELAGKAMPLIKLHGNQVVIQHCSPLISKDFRETLFAMVCELLTGDGQLSERESELVGLAALHLGISIEMMQLMITTFLIRNRWNAE